ncbi:MAG: YciI family protein [Massilia sp.]|nr:YciI family protein [Massilia sp.]
MHYLLCYDLAPDYLARRGQFRDAHLALAWQAQQRGELVLAGALSDPADMAVLMFQAESPELVNAFANADPYVTAGLVTGFRVRQWNTVVGEAAFAPVKI